MHRLLQVMLRTACLIVLFASALLVLPGKGLANGYQFGLAYTGDILSNVSGGVAAGSAYLDNLDITFEADVADTLGSGSGRIFIHGLYNNGAAFSENRVGDLQVVSNVEAARALRLYEIWLEVGERGWSVRTGLYDLNSEFDAHETGSLFLNSSHGIGAEIGQTGMNGPSIFPVTSLAVRGAIQLDRLAFRAAVLDGVPGDPDDATSNAVLLGGEDGALSIAEFDLEVGDRSRIWSGYWRYSGRFQRLDSPGTSNGNGGWYAGFETAATLSERSVAMFLRYGQANEQLNAIRDYVGAGLAIDSPMSARPDDQVGIAVASARVGQPYRALQGQRGEATRRRETVWELSYRARINQHLVLQPDIQFIQNPSALAAIDDALVIGLRFEIAY